MALAKSQSETENTKNSRKKALKKGISQLIMASLTSSSGRKGKGTLPTAGSFTQGNSLNPVSDALVSLHR